MAGHASGPPPWPARHQVAHHTTVQQRDPLHCRLVFRARRLGTLPRAYSYPLVYSISLRLPPPPYGTARHVLSLRNSTGPACRLTAGEDSPTGGSAGLAPALTIFSPFGSLRSTPSTPATGSSLPVLLLRTRSALCLVVVLRSCLEILQVYAWGWSRRASPVWPAFPAAFLLPWGCEVSVC